MVRDLPANVTVAMLPTTLSGELYAALLLPARPTMARLVAGSVITQIHAADAVEVERVLNNLLPPRGCVAKCAENLLINAWAETLVSKPRSAAPTSHG